MKSQKATFLAAAAIAIALAGCQVTSKEPGQSPAISEAEGRLDLDLPTLSGLTAVRTRRGTVGDSLIEERVDWRQARSEGRFAGLVLREYQGDPGSLTVQEVPTDPLDSIARWNVLARRSVSFDDSVSTTNSFGPATWRRFTMGASICVVFLQTSRAQSGDGGTALEGFYCTDAGEPLSAGQAETVVQSVRVREAPAREPTG